MPKIALMYKTTIIRQYPDKTPQEVSHLASLHGVDITPGYVTDTRRKDIRRALHRTIRQQQTSSAEVIPLHSSDLLSDQEASEIADQFCAQRLARFNDQEVQLAAKRFNLYIPVARIKQLRLQRLNRDLTTRHLEDPVLAEKKLLQAIIVKYGLESVTSSLTKFERRNKL